MTNPVTHVTRCQACRGALEPIVDAGLHPVANRFLGSPDQHESLFPLVLGQCIACALVQLTTIVPVDELAPRYPWITYNEPEGHLDAVADVVAALPGVARDAVVGAVTYKDDSTLARLRARGFTRTWRVDPAADLAAASGAGLETIQALLPDRADDLLRRYGHADVLLVRHILEHAHDTQRFSDALRRLVRPGGYLVFEVPDCSQVFDTHDYTTLWEEHILYLTPETYRGVLAAMDFEIVGLDVHPYPYENALVAIVRNTATSSHRAEAAALTVERHRMQEFARAFDARRRSTRAFLEERVATGARVALFGAGHLSCMFVNINQAAPFIDFVVDDHPGKRGLYMPGSRLPIRGSDALVSEGITLCLSSLSPESEDKVVAKQADFIARGGEFVSIFPSSRRALRFAGQAGNAPC